MHTLHAPKTDMVNLVQAIECLIQDTAVCYGLEISFSHCVQEAAVTPLLRNGVLRIVEQCVSNTRRHSRVRCAQLRLQHNGHCLRMEMEDRGVGFDPAKVGGRCFGLQWIRRCAAFLDGRAIITSTVGQGTRVVVEISIPDGGSLSARLPERGPL